MNIHISKEEHEFLLEYKNTEFVFGSYLYGTNAKNSDKDILIRWMGNLDVTFSQCTSISI